MKLKVVSVGRRAPGWVDAAFREYAKRMPRELPLSLVEVPAPTRGKDGARALREEGDRILRQLGASDRVVALDERGQACSSTELAEKLAGWRAGGSDVALVVGGADGLSQSVKERADETISLSKLTFPHYLVRVILAEALYRAWSIQAGHPYHRA